MTLRCPEMARRKKWHWHRLDLLALAVPTMGASCLLAHSLDRPVANRTFYDALTIASKIIVDAGVMLGRSVRVAARSAARATSRCI